MPKKEKILISVLIGLIIILAGVFGYAYQKKIWIFSKAEMDVSICGNHDINIKSLEAAITNKFHLGAKDNGCSAALLDAIYMLISDTKNYTCMIKVWPSGEKCSVIINGPNQPCGVDYGQRTEFSERAFKVEINKGIINLKEISLDELLKGEPIGEGFISDDFVISYQKFCAAIPKRPECCPKNQQQQQQQTQPQQSL